MERVILRPEGIRGLGDVIGEKELTDFDVSNALLVSSTDTVNGVEMTVYTSEYLTGSYLTKSGDGFILYSEDLSEMTVSVALRQNTSALINSAVVKCIINDDTVLSTTTENGIAVFNIPFVEGESSYNLRFVYEGNNNVAGCSVYGHIFVGVPTDLILNGSSEIIQSSDKVNLVATLTGTDVNGESVPIPSVTVMFYEKYNPNLDLNGDKSIIQTSDSLSLSAKVKDDDGSLVEGVTVYFYEKED